MWSSVSRVDLRGRTDISIDMTKVIVACLNFANASKIAWITYQDPVVTAQ